MQRCFIDGEEYWLYGDLWVPRRHFYDYGQEPIYIGPRRRTPPKPDLYLFVAWCVLGGYFILGKLVWHIV